MEDWKKRLGGYDSMNEAIFITIDGETIYTIDNLVDFIEQELSKAREEENKRCIKIINEIIRMSGEDSTIQWFDGLRCARESIKLENNK